MGLCFLAKFPVSFLRLPVTRHIHLGPPAAMRNHLPDRWTEYVPVGKRIPGTRFIAFKVPLKTKYDNKLEPRQRFSPTDLITEIEKQNEALGLIVDLTCTDRYYFPEELPRTIKYHKIFTAGQQIPSDNVYYEFKSIVSQYLRQNSENNKLVGVHCTHGLNRTGYLVCRYLIDVIGVEPSEAIEKFNKSRGHCMERENYLDDLLRCKSRNKTGLSKRSVPHASHPHHIPKRNFHSAPGSRPSQWQEEQPWFNGHTNANSGGGALLPTPVYAQPPRYHLPGPQHSFPQTGGRPPCPTFVNPVPAPKIPAPGFPHMPVPRHSFLQMESNPPQQARGGHYRPKHHRNRQSSPQGGAHWAQVSDSSYPQQNGVNSVNGAPVKDFPHRFPGKRSTAAWSSGSRHRGHSCPYQW